MDKMVSCKDFGSQAPSRLVPGQKQNSLKRFWYTSEPFMARRIFQRTFIAKCAHLQKRDIAIWRAPCANMESAAGKMKEEEIPGERQGLMVPRNCIRSLSPSGISQRLFHFLSHKFSRRSSCNSISGYPEYEI